MRFLGQVTRTISRKTAVLIFFAAVSAAYTGTCARAAATGMPMGAGSTVTGHVYVRAAVEEGYQADISVILAADFEGGTAHEYHLNPGNGYGVSDDIAEGSYLCVPFITDPEQDGTVYVEYGGGDKSVTREQDTVFVVVAGSADFVKSYLWISGLRDMEGGYLKGEISREQAEEAFQETVAGQRELQEEALDPAGSAPEDAAAAGDTPQGPPVPVPVQEAGAENMENKEKCGMRMAVFVTAAGTACLAVSAAAWSARKRH